MSRLKGCWSPVWKLGAGMTYLRAAFVMVLATAAGQASAAPPAGYHLTFGDEFNGTALDEDKWHHRFPGPRKGGVNVAEAVAVENGNLVIKTYTVDGEHRTGMIGTQNTFQQAYGYWEASIRFDGASGMWSAFWLQSPTYGNPVGNPETAGVEIDIVEHRATDSAGTNITGRMQSTLHWDGYTDDHQAIGNLTDDVGAGSGFHTYAFEWAPNAYRFFFDGQLVWEGTSAPISQRSQYIVLSSEVGDPDSWAGPVLPDYGTLSEPGATMYVDYVHVYSLPEPGSLVLLGCGTFVLLFRRQRCT